MLIKQCYQILELPSGATVEEVKQAYRDMVQVWHPDRFSQHERLQRLATQKFMEINLAYRTLMQMYGESVERDAQYLPDDTLIDWRPKPRLNVTPPAPPPPSSPAQQTAHTERPHSASQKTKGQSHRPFIWRWHYSVIVLPIIWLTVLVTLQLSRREPRENSVYTSNPEATLPRPKPVIVQPAKAGIGEPSSDTTGNTVADSDSLSSFSE